MSEQGGLNSLVVSGQSLWFYALRRKVLNIYLDWIAKNLINSIYIMSVNCPYPFPSTRLNQRFREFQMNHSAIKSGKSSWDWPESKEYRCKFKGHLSDNIPYRTQNLERLFEIA